MCTPKLLTLLIWYRYDWLFLRALVTAGYLGWIAFALTTAISHQVVIERVSRIKYFPAVQFYCRAAGLHYILTAVSMEVLSLLFLSSVFHHFYICI